jgi:ABC-type nitrate/sulfonate/bicarbonate transport system permease component
VFIGILALRFVAGWCIKLIERFPILESAAFVLIGYVGGILIVELTTHIHVTALQKFVGICVILALAIWYSESKAVQAVLGPIFKVLRLPLIAYAAVSNIVFGVVFFPFRLVIGLFKKKEPEAGEPCAHKSK